MTSVVYMVHVTCHMLLQVDLLYMQNLRGISNIEEVAIGVSEDNFNEVELSIC